MEICQSKIYYGIKLSMVLAFIYAIHCVSSYTVIAEGRTWLVEREALKNKTATIKSEIEELDVETLKGLEEEAKPLEVITQVVEKPAPIIVKAEPTVVVIESTMPTANDLSYEVRQTWEKKIIGTDAWNDLIKKVSDEEGVDPIFVKCVMAVESGGYQQAHNTKNANGTQDYGLMQVNTSWGSYFDYGKMLVDPEYAIRSGIQVIKCKVNLSQKNGKTPTVHEVLWRYNGKNARGKNYADRVSKLYEDLSNKTRNEIVLVQQKSA
ncbi:MAG: hypothetical protein A2Y24_06355 [Clostridiales bacterium GWE2_32_10]|nr:MAG: hypothetical protein A2Y24_06355 [Clostridiales bacterium GWE2_32_10]HBY19915.1 hypothetical protein [Clostridiales bacterium]